jgi:hypothetical protein
MSQLCRQLRKVDISHALEQLPGTQFVDTGGTNGWISAPPWLGEFVSGLGLSGKVTRALVRKLPAYQGIPAHIDKPMFGVVGERRYHVPLVTHPDVTMRWPEDGEDHHLEAGFLYEVDYTRLHEIVHRADVDRIHVQINVQ